MCKPQRIKDKVIGGYARTCPLCGAKVHTELTGMRLYKYKDGEDIFEFICCPTGTMSRKRTHKIDKF